ncbi:MAG: hypothetical protein WA771_02730 [Chthoniobacterales bacterium]
MTMIDNTIWAAFAEVLANWSLWILVALLVLSWGWVFHLVGRKAAHALGRRRLIYEGWAEAFRADDPRRQRVPVRRQRLPIPRSRPATPTMPRPTPSIHRSLSSRTPTRQSRTPHRTRRS